MENNNFVKALERVLKLEHQSRLQPELIGGSYALLFLEHYRLLSLYAEAANYQNRWLSDYFEISNTVFFSDESLEDSVKKIIHNKSKYESEMLFINWEFHKLKFTKTINSNLSNLPNPYEPMIIFKERGGWATFLSPFGFNVGDIFILKPKFEKIVELPPFIAFNEAAYRSADEEYSNDKAAFFEKYIRPVF